MRSIPQPLLLTVFSLGIPMYWNIKILRNSDPHSYIPPDTNASIFKGFLALKRKHAVPMIIIIIIIIKLTKSKQLPFLGYQKSDQNSKKKYKSLNLRIAFQTGAKYFM